MPKLNFLTPSLALIIVCMGFFLLYQCERSKRQNLERSNENIIWNEKLAAQKALAQTLADSVSILLENSKGRAVKDSLALSGLKMRNSAMSKKLAVLRIPVEVIADTIQPLRDYLILSDSLMAAKDTLIHEMTLRHSAQVVELDRIIDIQTQQIMAESVKTKLWEEVAVKTEKDYNKERRKKGFWKVTSAVLAGGIVFLSLKE